MIAIDFESRNILIPRGNTIYVLYWTLYEKDDILDTGVLGYSYHLKHLQKIRDTFIKFVKDWKRIVNKKFPPNQRYPDIASEKEIESWIKINISKHVPKLLSDIPYFEYIFRTFDYDLEGIEIYIDSINEIER
ncbi:MAG: hypothetical protein ACXAC2_17445 [Candidatus Kariarchaeaceae archaeon]